jgi:hypothetical protein
MTAPQTPPLPKPSLASEMPETPETPEPGAARPTTAPARQEGTWAAPVERLDGSRLPAGAINLAGRRPTSPIQGFGQLWQKTFRVQLPGAATTPAQVIAAWKEHYGEFWPAGNRFSAPLTGLAPGEVGVIRSAQGPMQLSTGVLVLYADDESFTFMTPEGHPFAGWITFSASAEGDAPVAAQVQALIRASDPIYEVMFKLGFGKVEDQMWVHTLTQLAAYFGVHGQSVETSITCVDRRRQWAHAGNVWQNAGIRSSIHTVGAPVRFLARPFRRHA